MRAFLICAALAASITATTHPAALAQDATAPETAPEAAPSDPGVIPEPDLAPEAPAEPPMAEPAEPEKPASPAEAAIPSDLDGMFAALRRERDAARAARISRSIWREWGRYEDETVNLFANWAASAMSRKKYGVALDLLDRVTVMAPDYAEGWNKRATLHFLRRDFAKSLADIERTLALEPRHFGALAGMGTILVQLDRKPEALAVWYRALAIYPTMKAAQTAVEKLEEELAGRGI